MEKNGATKQNTVKKLSNGTKRRYKSVIASRIRTKKKKVTQFTITFSLLPFREEILQNKREFRLSMDYM
jgi:hypothetical protein